MNRGHTALAGILLALAPTFGWAEDDALQKAMATLPSYKIGADSGAFTHYVNVQAVMARGDGTFSPQNWPPATAMADFAPVRALLAGDSGGWAEKSGAAVDQIMFLAGYGTPPRDVAIWGFADEAIASTAFKALTDRGFLPAEGIPDFIANGAPMQMNLAARDLGNPWLGPMGQPSAVTQRGSILFQIFDPNLIETLRGAPVTLADDPGGQTLLAALEARQGQVLQAEFFGAMAGLHGIDPALMISPNPETVQAEVAAAVEKANSGVPLYSTGVLAILNGPDRLTTVLALAYGDCAVAGTAAEKAAGFWQALAGAPEGLSVDATTFDAGAAGCAAVVAAHATDEAAPFLSASGGMVRQDFAPIRIGTE